ncbi:response regulator [Lysobacter soli]|uniref:response regulator n=1 Tax=Lysobacter soli TaxID=453783 RepID=UPI0037CB41A4
MRILLAEDDAKTAECVVMALESLGHKVVVASNVSDALVCLDHDSFDVAMLDIELGNELSFQIAEQLTVRGLPYFFASGRDPADMPMVYAAAPYLRKPYLLEQLVTILRTQCGSIGTTKF